MGGDDDDIGTQTSRAIFPYFRDGRPSEMMMVSKHHASSVGFLDSGGGVGGMMTTLVHRHPEQYLHKGRFTRCEDLPGHPRPSSPHRPRSPHQAFASCLRRLRGSPWPNGQLVRNGGTLAAPWRPFHELLLWSRPWSRAAVCHPSSLGACLQPSFLFDPFPLLPGDDGDGEECLSTNATTG